MNRIKLWHVTKNYNDGQHYFDIIDLENDLPADNRAQIIREITSIIDKKL